MKVAASNGCQIIAAVHNPWVIEAFPNVYDVGARKPVTSADYLASQRIPLPPDEPKKPAEPEPTKKPDPPAERPTRSRRTSRKEP